MIGLNLPTIISLAITLVIAITVHEFSHAYAADLLGDPTPRRDGRLTLNPMMHLDPIGSIIFVVSGFGWGRPVLTNPYNLRPPLRTSMAIVAAAGPFSNLILALLGAIPYRLGVGQFLNIGEIPGIVPSVAGFLHLFISVNIGLMLFNLIPIAPLDGSKIAVGVLPREWAEPLARLEPYGPIILLFLLMSGRFGFDIFGRLIGPAQGGLFSLITGL
ncbi:MAG TPA: site-2 protease family protein [Anaerolineales bacterium]|nr:site-2 protease family protein [Anaerolineales bacterium]HLF03546.1 site-2 protease family protein [Anaerolineales bacterium]